MAGGLSQGGDQRGDVSAAAGSELVLLVDDEAPLLRVLGHILRGDGHRVAQASSPLELGPILADQELAVVLLDLVTGQSNGLSVLERIKLERPDVEVVVMTRQGSIESAIGCMRSGAFEYLVKPFDDMRRLRSAVRRALGRRRLAARGGEQQELLRLHSSIPLSLEAYEKLALERALRESDGDATAAARRLGIGRSTFYRKSSQRGISLQRGAQSKQSPKGRGQRSVVDGVGGPGSIG